MFGQPFRLPQGGSIDRQMPLSFEFEGERVAGFAGDTLRSALLANGIRVTGKSRRHRRPRGLVSLSCDSRLRPRNLASGKTPAAASNTPAALDAYGASRDLSAAEHFDVAVVGAGAAGLTAALVAANAGAKVCLLEAANEAGGWLLHESRCVGGMPAHAWARATAAKTAQHANISLCLGSRVLRTGSGGIIDGERLGAGNPGEGSSTDKAVSRPSFALPFSVTAHRIVIATGAFERALTFQDNDRPGVMLASAVRGYLNRFAVACGSAVLIATNNDGGYLTAFDLADAGVAVAAIVDERSRTPSFIFDEACKRKLRVLTEAYAGAAHYPGALRGAFVYGLEGREIASIACDCIGMAGGLQPAATPLASGLPSGGGGVSVSAGSAAGVFALRACISNAAKAGAEAALAAGFFPSRPWIAPDADPLLNTHRVEGLAMAVRGNPKRAYVDFERDITAYEAATSSAVASVAVRAGPKPDRLYGASALGFFRGKSWA